MTRLTIAIIAAALLGAAAMQSVAHASPPAPLSPPVELPPEFPGSVSGRIVIEGQPPVPYQRGIIAISADVPQPINVLVLGPEDGTGPRLPDDQGNFTLSGLADGEFFLLLEGDWEFVEPPGEDVLIGESPAEAFTLSGLRFTIIAGGAVTGLEIVVRRVAPIVDPGGQLSPVGAPSTGASPSGANDTSGRIAAGLAALAAAAAALLLAGGVALRAKSGLAS